MKVILAILLETGSIQPVEATVLTILSNDAINSNNPMM